MFQVDPDEKLIVKVNSIEADCTSSEGVIVAHPSIQPICSNFGPFDFIGSREEPAIRIGFKGCSIDMYVTIVKKDGEQSSTGGG